MIFPSGACRLWAGSRGSNHAADNQPHNDMKEFFDSTDPKMQVVEIRFLLRDDTIVAGTRIEDSQEWDFTEFDSGGFTVVSWMDSNPEVGALFLRMEERAGVRSVELVHRNGLRIGIGEGVSLAN